MKKNLLFGFAIIMAFVAGSLFSSRQTSLDAQTNFTDDEVINIVATSSQFSSALADVEAHVGSWNAVTFNTKNAYGIWRVYFSTPEGDEVGWADLNPQNGKIYSWDLYIPATDAQKEVAMPIIKDFLNGEPAILELLDNPAQYEMYIDYDGWNNHWGVYIGAGEYALWVTVQFDGGALPNVLENPELTGVYFPDLPDYDQWLQDTQAQAVNIAFANADIGAALRGNTWTTQSERIEGDIWSVAFFVDDTLVVTATVDLISKAVIEVVTP
jgi:hypothetical protein